MPPCSQLSFVLGVGVLFHLATLHTKTEAKRLELFGTHSTKATVSPSTGKDRTAALTSMSDVAMRAQGTLLPWPHTGLEPLQPGSQALPLHP